MSVKLNFKIERSKFNQTHGGNADQAIKNELEKCFNSKHIQFIRIYFPSHKYVKILLATEKLVEDVFKARTFFNDKGFDPALTMPLKIARTVFCYGFDPALLTTHDKDAFKQLVIDANWQVESVCFTITKVNENRV